MLNWVTLVLDKDTKEHKEHREKEHGSDKVKNKEAKATEKLRKKEEYIDALLLSIINKDVNSDNKFKMVSCHLRILGDTNL